MKILIDKLSRVKNILLDRIRGFIKFFNNYYYFILSNINSSHYFSNIGKLTYRSNEDYYYINQFHSQIHHIVFDLSTNSFLKEIIIDTSFYRTNEIFISQIKPNNFYINILYIENKITIKNFDNSNLNLISYCLKQTTELENLEINSLIKEFRWNATLICNLLDEIELDFLREEPTMKALFVEDHEEKKQNLLLSLKKK